MIKFRQKDFSEYDAMRSLYVELLKKSDRNKFKVIDTSALIPILKGNNIVIEKFVISTSLFGRDKYRMYLKIGAKAKLPDEVRLPGKVYDKRLLSVRLTMKGGAKAFEQHNQSDTTEPTEVRVKLFGKNNGGGPDIGSEISPNLDFTIERQELLGNAVKYDKKARLLVLDFNTIYDAINALNILPFGLNYNIYLLNA